MKYTQYYSRKLVMAFALAAFFAVMYAPALDEAGEAQAKADRFDALTERLEAEKGGARVLPDEYAAALDLYNQAEALFQAENYGAASARYRDALTQFQNISRIIEKKEENFREASAYRVSVLTARLALFEQGGALSDAGYADALGAYQKGEEAFQRENYAEALSYYWAALKLFQDINQTAPRRAAADYEAEKLAAQARMAALWERLSVMEFGGFRGRPYEEALKLYEYGEAAFSEERYGDALSSYTAVITRFQDIKRTAALKQQEARQALIDTEEQLNQSRNPAVTGRR
ncbi:MAG: hypothetical protein LBD13_05825 [Spirochaetaceae bacterium]|jgi:tetratricopeptide (TPR) repeat protein|nr:hypothetical protein [Spirochaetaceae bacterium]